MKLNQHKTNFICTASNGIVVENKIYLIHPFPPQKPQSENIFRDLDKNYFTSSTEEEKIENHKQHIEWHEIMRQLKHI